MYQALYRKYRPSVFSDVCGQEHITSVLRYQTESGRVSHAYLFCGSRGTGKTTCAKILAKAVNCENPQNGEPCGVCEACRAIDAGSAPDVLEMDAASNNGVDYIRDLRDTVAYTPAMLKKRVYIIDEVHMLSTSAFNALLKTLEEPPEYVVFILATTELHKLPSTIISRCQRFDFRRIPLQVLSDRLMHIASCENIRLEEAAAQQIAKQAQGGMRDAISLFELCGGGGADVTLSRVEDVLGLSSYEFLRCVATALAKGDMQALFGMIDSVCTSSKDIAVFWQELSSFYRDMMVDKYCADTATYLDLTEQEMAILRQVSAQFSPRLLLYHCNVLDTAMANMQRAPHMKRTIAEFACMRMCDPRLDASTEALSARIAQLEDRLAMIEIGGVNVSAPTAEATSSAPVREEIPPKVPQSQPAPVTTDPAEEMEFDPLPDVSEFLEKMGQIDKQAQSFLTDADILVSADGKQVRILTGNAFALMMLSKDTSKNAIARAMALCRITDGQAEIVVREAPKKDTGYAVDSELY